MILLSNDQIKLLKSRYIASAAFKINGFTFNCLEGEWQVLKNDKHIDVFTFRYMNDKELKQTLNDIFYNTEKVAFQ